MSTPLEEHFTPAVHPGRDLPKADSYLELWGRVGKSQTMQSLGSLPALEPVNSFTTQEGPYVLREDIRHDTGSNPYIGTSISFITIKSNNDSPAPVAVTENQDLGQPARFVEIPLDGEGAPADKGTFSFLVKSKGKKGKSTTSKSGSSFVSKIVAHDQLAKLLTYRAAETTYMFCNVGKQFIWADYMRKPQDPLSCIHFKDAYVTCHDVNLMTRESLDAVIGFSCGHVMWYGPISGKYVRYNRQGVINKSAVTCIKWMPGSENLFIAGYEDGSVVIYDKDKDDQPFTPVLPSDSDS
ncbi:hypothetical protein HK104_006025 [Borealophlyctis nickersoniae]|nr:hypothetical protein HK104_006025 [Borealophlyctis nickersoniae]